MKSIRWGIIGLGKIAHKFATDLLLIEDCKLVAVGSSDINRAKKFANKYNVSDFFGSYKSFFDNAKVDIVYVASLNPKHMELTIASLNSGIAVLCEKPLALNSIQVNAMISKAKEKKLFLMEALWTRFNPAFEQSLNWINQGLLGKLRYINASFSFYGLDKGDESRIFDLKKGGGTLLDIGIYPLFLAYKLLGMPNNIKVSGHLTKGGVDEQLAFILSFDNALAVLYSSFVHNEDMRATIAGEEGEIYIDSRWHESSNITLVKDKKNESKVFDFIGIGYSYEIIEANKCLREGKLESSKWSHKNTTDLMLLMDTIRKEIGVVYPNE
jgi:predicted dehydrogenase